MIAERPIIFSAPMVRALLAGTKTQTRRIVKSCKDRDVGCELAPHEIAAEVNAGVYRNCRHGAPGDRLWVRETHDIYPTHGQHRADGKRWGPWGGLPTTVSEDGKQIAYYRQGFDRCDPGRWRPSIHMPRWASRITLEITGVRIQRLRDISSTDALAEGVNVHPDHHSKPASSIYGPVQAFRDLWERIHGEGSWDVNPWVAAIEFRRVS